MEGLYSGMIPAWVVGLVMVYSGVIWLLSRTKRIRMDTRVIALTLIVQGIIYGTIYQFGGLDIESRGFYTRLMLILLCLSQSLPLTISYIRSIGRGD